MFSCSVYLFCVIFNSPIQVIYKNYKPKKYTQNNITIKNVMKRLAISVLLAECGSADATLKKRLKNR